MMCENGKIILCMQVGKKIEQDFNDIYCVDLCYYGGVSVVDYFLFLMLVDKGLLDIFNYCIEIEVILLDDKCFFLYFSYVYFYGMVSKLVLCVYLMMVGCDKVGFSVVKCEVNGQLQYVLGSCVMVECNIMCYYLVIDVYLFGLEVLVGEWLEKWFMVWYGVIE